MAVDFIGGKVDIETLMGTSAGGVDSGYVLLFQFHASVIDLIFLTCLFLSFPFFPLEQQLWQFHTMAVLSWAQILVLRLVPI